MQGFSPRAFVWLAASAAALGTASPVQAAGPGWSKAEAILGGAPSALEAVIAQQQAIAPARSQAVQPASYQPGSYSLPRVMPAVLPSGPALSPGVLSGNPDVFGSVALRIGNTRLDARWRRADKAGVDGPAARFAESLTNRGKLQRLEAVNWYVNRRVTFTDDQRRWGLPDVWSTANETLKSGRGDCEDYAIAKLQMLRRAGFADRDLYLVIVKDLVSRQDHAVLVVRAAGRMNVLDNGTDQLLDSETLRDYRPILTFASYGTWTHGYRVQSAPVDIASADDSPETIAPAADNQRSWSASLLAFNTGLSR